MNLRTHPLLPKDYKCECVTFAHKRRCEKIATWICMKCLGYLCGHCVNNHHAHPQDCITLKQYQVATDEEVKQLRIKALGIDPGDLNVDDGGVCL